MKKNTIRDVAELAGVSYVTVSNVLNDKGRMSPETKKRVKQAMKKLNFYPDSTARILSTGKSDTVAFVSSYLSSPFVSGVLAGVEHRLHETGKLKHDLVHYATKGADAVKSNLIEDLLYGKKSGAVILLTLNIKQSLASEFKKRDIPLVMIESHVKGAHSVRADNFAGSYNAAKYFLKTGRKNIVVVTGQLKPSAFDADVSPAEQERLDGFKKALKDAGKKFDPKNHLSVPFYNMEEGARCMGNLLKASSKVDAVFCAAGDLVAIGMMQKAKKAGRKIPKDIAFIGFDDIPMAEAVKPKLTTVRQPLYEMGIAAFDIVSEAVGKKAVKSKNKVLNSELIIREST